MSDRPLVPHPCDFPISLELRQLAGAALMLCHGVSLGLGYLLQQQGGREVKASDTGLVTLHPLKMLDKFCSVLGLGTEGLTRLSAGLPPERGDSEAIDRATMTLLEIQAGLKTLAEESSLDQTHSELASLIEEFSASIPTLQAHAATVQKRFCAFHALPLHDRKAAESAWRTKTMLAALGSHFAAGKALLESLYAGAHASCRAQGPFCSPVLLYAPGAVHPISIAGYMQSMTEASKSLAILKDRMEAQADWRTSYAETQEVFQRADRNLNILLRALAADRGDAAWKARYMDREGAVAEREFAFTDTQRASLREAAAALSDNGRSLASIALDDLHAIAGSRYAALASSSPRAHDAGMAR